MLPVPPSQLLPADGNLGVGVPTKAVSFGPFRKLVGVKRIGPANRRQNQGDRPKHLSILLLINRLSNNADSVNPFFPTPLHALREERHFALVEGFAFPTVGSLVIRFRSEVSIRPMHLFDPQLRS